MQSVVGMLRTNSTARHYYKALARNNRLARMNNSSRMSTDEFWDAVRRAMRAGRRRCSMILSPDVFDEIMTSFPDDVDENFVLEYEPMGQSLNVTIILQHDEKTMKETTMT